MSAVMTREATARKRIAPLDWESLIIRLGPLQQKLTDDEFFEFCQLNDELRIEMTSEGEMIIMMPAGSEGGRRNFSLAVEFGIWAKADGTGIRFDSSTGFILPNSAKRAPDLSWIRRERWEAIPKKQRKKFAPICPDFVVELRSETDRLTTLKKKMEEYLANGALLGWLIDQLENKVYIYRPGVAVEALDNPPALSGEPLLRGLRLDLTRVLE